MMITAHDFPTRYIDIGEKTFHVVATDQRGKPSFVLLFLGDTQ